jgi:catechol 2,3-dioxygenase-like lactoylglutathione lyase family enzyme
MKQSRSYIRLRKIAAGTALLIVVIASAVAAAHTQETQSTPSLDGIAHVAMRVANLEASRAFYKRLGFEEAFAFAQGGSPTEAFIKVNDTQFIELYPQRQPGEPVGFLHVCYLSRDLEALNQAYRARGLRPTAVSRGGAGNLLFSLTGPGLENIEFTQYMPGSRHTNDIGKHLGEHRISTRITGIAFPSDDPEGAASFYARGMGFRRSNEHPGKFRLPGDSTGEIEILSAAHHHLRVTMEVHDLKQAAHELQLSGIPATRQHAALTIHDPDGNDIELKQTVGR